MSAQLQQITGHNPISMRQRQSPLRSLYASDPDQAWITDSATTSSDDVDTAQAIHGQVAIGNGTPVKLDTGNHVAIGGDSDLPNPGEILAAALAACLDSTVRIIANLTEVRITHLEVAVDFKVDVRGTLMVDRTVPVGFQEAEVCVHMLADGASDAQLDMVLKAAEKCCVVMQTLRNPPAMRVSRTASINQEQAS